MQFRQLGKSELKIPVVSFGAWAIGGWMWGGADEEQAIRAIHAAIDHGMTFIDTAPVYGMGRSEHIVGKAVKDRRDSVTIGTKAGMRWDLAEGDFFFKSRDNKDNEVDIYKNLKPHSIRYECEQSLRRLNIDCIDLYQCHWPDSTTPLADTMEALLQLQKEGKIRVIGVSNFSPEQMETCLKYGRIESDQPRYSALDRRIEADILPFCRENNLGVLAYSPLEQGLLTGKAGPDRQFKEGDQRRDKALFARENRIKVLDMLETVRPIAEAYDATFSQLFLAWLTSQEGMATTLAGARNETQVLENAGAGDIRLSEAHLAEIRRQVESVDLER